MLFNTGDRLHLADLIAFCQFSTEFSLGLSLRHPGENEGVEIGWMDLHLTSNERREKIYFRICLQVELTTTNRIDAIMDDCYRALAIPASANFEIKLFWADKSILLFDGREGFISGGGSQMPLDAPLLDYHFESE